MNPTKCRVSYMLVTFTFTCYVQVEGEGERIPNNHKHSLPFHKPRCLSQFPCRSCRRRCSRGSSRCLCPPEQSSEDVRRRSSPWWWGRLTGVLMVEVPPAHRLRVRWKEGTELVSCGYEIGSFLVVVIVVHDNVCLLCFSWLAHSYSDGDLIVLLLLEERRTENRRSSRDGG